MGRHIRLSNNTATDQNYSRIYDVSQELTAKKVAVGQNTKVRLGLSPTGQTMFVTHEATVAAAGRPVKRGRSGKPLKPWSLHKIAGECNRVLKDIERLIEHEFGGPCDTDDGELLFEQALPYLVARHMAYERPEKTLNTMEWAWKYTRRVVADHPRAWFDDAEQNILAAFDNYTRPSVPDRDGVSRALRITGERKERCGLKHLCAIERPPAVRARDRKVQNRDHNKGKRAAAGATPREESMTARRPWEKYGCSKSTYKRRVANGEIPPDPVMLKRRTKATAKAPVLRLVS